MTTTKDALGRKVRVGDTIAVIDPTGSFHVNVTEAVVTLVAENCVWFDETRSVFGFLHSGATQPNRVVRVKKGKR